MTDWQTMETAPMDGTVIMGAWTDSKGIVAMFPILWRASVIYPKLFGWHTISWPDLNLQLAVTPVLWYPMPVPKMDAAP